MSDRNFIKYICNRTGHVYGTELSSMYPRVGETVIFPPEDEEKSVHKRRFEVAEVVHIMGLFPNDNERKTVHENIIVRLDVIRV